VVVCIDTLNRSIAGSENDDETMSAYVRAADDIRAAFGCLVIIVHHCGHGGDRPRGHSSLMGALDVQISVKRDPAENIVAELAQIIHRRLVFVA
jgi:RecA-family ATPase